MIRTIDIELTEDGTILEVVEIICTMTGFRSRRLIHHIGEGFFRSMPLMAA